MALTDLQLRIKKLNEIDLPVALQNLIIENEGIIIETLQSQLIEGKTGADAPIMLYGEEVYSPFTIEYKRAFGRGIGAITDHITLYMFGGFYENMFMTVKGENFTIKSNVPYFDKILERSGADVMKLTQENFDSIMQNFINPELEKIVVESLNGY